MKKLQNGDYCENLTKEQFDELIEIENCLFHKSDFDADNPQIGYDYNDNSLYKVFFKKNNKLSFEDFKQRAINTFKK